MQENRPDRRSIRLSSFSPAKMLDLFKLWEAWLMRKQIARNTPFHG
jgi:hypothetical protein